VLDGEVMFQERVEQTRVLESASSRLP